MTYTLQIIRRKPNAPWCLPGSGTTHHGHRQQNLRRRLNCNLCACSLPSCATRSPSVRRRYRLFHCERPSGHRGPRERDLCPRGSASRTCRAHLPYAKLGANAKGPLPGGPLRILWAHSKDSMGVCPMQRKSESQSRWQPAFSQGTTDPTLSPSGVAAMIYTEPLFLGVTPIRRAKLRRR